MAMRMTLNGHVPEYHLWSGLAPQVANSRDELFGRVAEE